MTDPIRQPHPDFYTWGFTGAPISIHLKLDVVSKLHTSILDTKEGMSCGLLVGDAQRPGVTTILDFTPLQTLDAASVEAANRVGAGEVVGFYRTTPAGVDSMSEEDKLLAASYFQRPSSVFMLVEKGESGIGDAHFCFWGEGALFDFPLMAFPLNAEELASREGLRRLHKVPAAQSSSGGLAAVKAADAPPEDFGRVQEARGPAAKRRPGSRRGWLVLAAATLVVVLMFAVSLLYSWRNSSLPVVSRAAAPVVEAPAPLGLSVERRGKDLRVSWNGSADKVAKADFGMLLIRGSGVSRDVPLTADELRSGSVVYAAASDNLRLQLNVVGGGQVAREFLTVVMPQESEVPPIPATPVNRNLEPGGVRRPAASGSPGARQFKAPGAPVSSTAASLAEPPPISGSAPANTINPALLSRPAIAANPPASGGTAPPAAQAQRPPQAPTQPSNSEAQPPMATHQVVPPVPALLRGMIWKPTTVDVNVLVDELGRVTKAEAPAKAGLHPLLREAAVQAALRWKFQPAHFNGHPVPANLVLQFNFAANR